jgi:hypothetical protein
MATDTPTSYHTLNNFSKALAQETRTSSDVRFTDFRRSEAGDLTSELRELVQQYPYQERLHAALMLALYRVGRQADALATYRDVRMLLQEALGVEVSDDLRLLHRAILSHDPQLAARSHRLTGLTKVATGSKFLPSEPRTLPPDIRNFVGREKEVDQIVGLLREGSRTAVPVVTITGPDGVGKTALSIRAAHGVRDQYPDGQLYVDLRGFDQAATAEPFDVLGRFLRAFGVAGSSIPGTRDERVEVYRGILSGRRVLVNAM